MAAPAENKVNSVEVLEKLRSNDPSLTKLNLNNFNDASKPDGKPDVGLLEQLVEALKSNTHLVELQFAGNGSHRAGGLAIAELLKVNKTLLVLNLENNYIDSDAVAAIFQALADNTVLQELKVANQIGKPLATDVGRNLATWLDKNEVVVKVTVDLREQSSRNALDKIIFRNKEIARKKRLAAKK